ncbi:MAG: virulence protein RhuM/Fic/DOC family protein [Gammaproteobacteria bacterium]|nr:virulence protein RhuM/Fic/DOC family protein [Gammaproteobacteria bacterium]
MVKKNDDHSVAIYQLQSGALQLKADFKKDTIWVSLMQIAELFNTDKSGISRHIKNIFESDELSRRATVAKFATVQKEGKRDIVRDIEYFNLDVVLSVGYRVNSQKATHFRQWATQVLKNHITQGYTINRRRIKANYGQFLKAIDDVKSLLPAGSTVDHGSVIELIKLFADTWFSLDAYDRDQLPIEGGTKKKVKLTAEKLSQALAELKNVLLAKNEATEIFGVERSRDSIAGIIGNVMQSFGDQELYPTIEIKAANLLYFMIKNHPFIDGNKRSGAYAFIWYLRQAKILDVTKITPAALTAITLLIAESAPKDKEKMVGLVCALLKDRDRSSK